MNTQASEVYDSLLSNLENSINFIKEGHKPHVIGKSSVLNHYSAGRPEKQYIASITSANSNFSPVFSDHVLSSPSRHGLTLEDFKLMKVIGKGGFSKVFQGIQKTEIIDLVRKKDTGKIYAMKTLSKSKIKRNNKVENIKNERAILEKVTHPFIIQMQYAFQNVRFRNKLLGRLSVSNIRILCRRRSVL